MSDDLKPDGAKPADAGPSVSRVPALAPARPRAFPVTKLVVSVVGIAVAVWIWFGSGWRWDVTARDLAEGRPPLALGSWAGRYVRLTYPVAEGQAPSEVRPALTGVAKGSLRGRVVVRKMGDAPASVVVDATLGRWNSRAVMAILICLWGLAHGVASVYLWRRRRELAARRAGV